MPRPFRPGVDLDHRADQLAKVVRRAFEPSRAPSTERYEEAATQVVAAFTRLADQFRHTAYGTAAD